MTDWQDVELCRDPETGATSVAYMWRQGSVRGLRRIHVPSGRLSTYLDIEAADGSIVTIEADHVHRIVRLQRIVYDQEPAA